MTNKYSKPISIYIGKDYMLKIYDIKNFVVFTDDDTSKYCHRKIYGNYFIYKNNERIKLSKCINTF